MRNGGDCEREVSECGGEVIKESLILARGGLNIHYDIYRCGEHKGADVVQIAHGMVEHRAYYEYIATILARNGFVVACNDHRGHGDSVGGGISLGEMGENGFEAALQDMFALHNALCARFKPRRFILIGHSMGSLLARRFLQEWENRLDALILCGTPSPYFGINLGIGILEFLQFVGLKRVGQNLAQNLSFLGFNRAFAKGDDFDNGKPSGMAWINRDSAQIRAYVSDSKRRFVFSINSFICLLRGLKAVFSPYPRRAQKPHLPILFISGENDACGRFGKGVLAAYKHLIAQGYDNVKCVLYAGARHELFLELNKDEVIGDVVRFIRDSDNGEMGQCLGDT